jgi:hypothetical protein
LPEAALEVSTTAGAAPASFGETVLTVHITNSSEALAFGVRLRLTDGEAGKDVRPVFWDDNHFEMAPGESRDLRVAYRAQDLKGAPFVAVDGWNVKRK